ncbi:Uncharacterised protein [Mycobacteroides abscessus subsp. bolletii]|uniref:hypothetical protein n=1 Tax=Mycobacteroides abscessus TaxID=36809 RepID=UPI0009A6BD9D|nr:hypothetical protein [Mycobacteroides abscessus]SKX80885.1 Uncharacterised protein [Mycobacteroides abscessus subsp. bolletii]
MSLKKTGQLSAGTTAVCFITAGVIAYGFFNGFDFLRDAFTAAATVVYVIVFLAAVAAAVGFGGIWLDHKLTERRTLKAKQAKEIADLQRRASLPILCGERPSTLLGGGPCVEPLFHVGLHKDKYGSEWFTSVNLGDVAF